MNTRPTDFDLIAGWFAKAGMAAARQGKADSSALWADGLAQLKRLKASNDELLAALILCKNELTDKTAQDVAAYNAACKAIENAGL